MKEKNKSFSVALASTVLVLFLFLIPSAASAVPLTIEETQITNSGAAGNPEIYEDKIVWQDTRNEDSNIYIYDLLTKKETQITKYDENYNPDIYDNKIVYLWQAATENSANTIEMYDLSTKNTIMIGPLVPPGAYMQPAIYGNRIVWDCGDIWMYNLSDDTETQISNESGYESAYNPAIYEDKIVWTDDNVHIYDLSNGTETQITTSESASSPAIYGNEIVWEDYRSGNYYPEIYVYDLFTHKETIITAKGSLPDIYKDKIVWQDWRNSTDYMDDNPNIYMYDLSTNTEAQITTSGSASSPRIYGNRIVWQDGRNGKSDIYMATLTVVANFSAKPTEGKAPLTVVFTDKSIGKPTKWKWNFGDGTTSTLQNPTHKYSKVGSYTVKLTAINDKGSNTATKTDYIKVVTKPVASFSAKPTSGKTPLTVAFTDKSIGIPTKWKWNFGDGKTSTVQNPKHQYLQEGKYKVTLTVTNAAGSNTTTKTNYIKVTTNTRPGIYSESE